MDFLFHKVSEKEKEEIKKQAKKIIDDFSEQLNKVNGKVSESFIELGGGQRAPQAYNRKGCENLQAGPDKSSLKISTKGKSEVKCNEINRETFFENAPETKGDFIVGEEKKW